MRVWSNQSDNLYRDYVVDYENKVPQNFSNSSLKGHQKTPKRSSKVCKWSSQRSADDPQKVLEITSEVPQRSSKILKKFSKRPQTVLKVLKKSSKYSERTPYTH